MKKLLRPSLLLLLLALPSLLLAAPRATVSTGSVEVMVWNLENLFDTEHDADKDDYTFLPSADPLKDAGCEQASTPYYRTECIQTNWDQNRFQLKLAQIKRVLTQGRTTTPDIFAIEEVENEAAVAALAQTLGYTSYVVSDSPDERGIDVAVLFKRSSLFRKVESVEYAVESEQFADRPTRNILEVVFAVGSERLSLFVNHWPSQSNPTAYRLDAARTLAQAASARMNQGHKIIAVGDFNTTSADRPNPFNVYITGDTQDSIGMLDMHTEYLNNTTGDCTTPINPGSYFYKKDRAWNVLDHVFFSPDLITRTKRTLSKKKQSLSVDLKSYRIHNPSFMTTPFKMGQKVVMIPMGYDHTQLDPAKAGYSDHFPLLFKLRY